VKKAKRASANQLNGLSFTPDPAQHNMEQHGAGAGFGVKRPHSTGTTRTPTFSRGSSPTRPTRAISLSYSCGKLNGEVARHADILATIIAREDVGENVGVGVGVVECGLKAATHAIVPYCAVPCRAGSGLKEGYSVFRVHRENAIKIGTVG